MIRRNVTIWLLIFAAIALPLVPVLSGVALAALVATRWYAKKTDVDRAAYLARPDVQLQRNRTIVRRMLG